jgi:tetratricopeptide (TPR) repeat protein
MKKKQVLMLLVFALFAAQQLVAQDIDLGNGFNRDKEAKLNMAMAEEHFALSHYYEALPLYRSLEGKYGKNPLLMFRIGICLLHKTDETALALDYLTKVKANNPRAANIDLYIAKAYHLNGRYDDALKSLEEFYKQKHIDENEKQEAIKLKRYCQNAKALIINPVNATITNLGAPVNSEWWEYVPVVTSDDSTLYFTYLGDRSMGGLQELPGQADASGDYYEDIFASHRGPDGKWQMPQPLDTVINTNGPDAAIAGTNDGQTLLVYRATTEDNGDIYISQLFGETWAQPEKLYGDVNTFNWEGSATFSPDGRTIYFASERPGGYGGRDIWQAEIQPDGSWGKVKNMGALINTVDNEDAPYMHSNGVTMVFSSEGHNSMGGYDIFTADYNSKDSSFGQVSNIGYPINTPGDDKYFVINPDGKHGYYSSGKPGGLGNQDIYSVEMVNSSLLGDVVLISGVITLDGQPARGVVTVKSDSVVLSKFYVYTNSKTGRYMVNLPVGHIYELTYELEGLDKQTKAFDTRNISKYSKITHDAAFMSTIYPNSRVVTEGGASTKQVGDTSVPRGDYNAIVKKYGDISAPDLIYRVQVAAYAYPQNYRNKQISKFGKPEHVKLNDGITRITLGKFTTLAEAEAFRQKIVAAGAADAFVTAERLGQRYLLKELVNNNFFKNENRK